MTGSFWAPIIIPIVAVLALAAWLALVWYAAAHPRWKAHRAASAPGVTGAMFRMDTSKQVARRQANARPWPAGAASGSASDRLGRPARRLATCKCGNSRWQEWPSRRAG